MGADGVDQQKKKGEREERIKKKVISSLGVIKKCVAHININAPTHEMHASKQKKD